MKEKRNYKCFVCDTPLTEENSSYEHIILNACGGKLKSNKLLCKKCNSQIGTKADTELSNQLNFFSTFINVDRDRGNLQPIKGAISKDGKDYTLLPGEVNTPVLSDPDVKKVSKDNRTEISITSSDFKVVDKIFKDLKRKYPSFDIEEANKRLKITNQYLSEPLNFSHEIGGDLAFRSIVKTGVEFFLFSGGESRFIKHLIPYLKGKEDRELIWFAPFVETPYDLDNKEISHFLYIKADSKERVISAFVDFFNAYTYFMCLNDNYTGHDFEKTYCFDLLNKKEIKKTFNINLNRQDVLKLSKKSQPTHNEFMAIKNRIGRTFMIADDRQASNQLSKIIRDSLEKTMKKLCNPEKFTEEVMNEYINELIKNYMPFFIHRNNRKR